MLCLPAGRRIAVVSTELLNPVIVDCLSGRLVQDISSMVGQHKREEVP
jgi:hypothetical protein